MFPALRNGTAFFGGRGCAEDGVGVRAIVLAGALGAQCGGDAGLARGRIRLRRVQRGRGSGGAHKTEEVGMRVFVLSGVCRLRIHDGRSANRRCVWKVRWCKSDTSNRQKMNGTRQRLCAATSSIENLHAIAEQKKNDINGSHTYIPPVASRPARRSAFRRSTRRARRRSPPTAPRADSRAQCRVARARQ